MRGADRGGGQAVGRPGMLEVQQFSQLIAARFVVSLRHKGMSDHNKPEGGQH